MISLLGLLIIRCNYPLVGIHVEMDVRFTIVGLCSNGGRATNVLEIDDAFTKQPGPDIHSSLPSTG